MAKRNLGFRYRWAE